MITDYQAKYIAHDLTRRRPSDSADRLAVAVAGAQVDMNPHQVDAALFAFASPLSKGALLADEVGLGKTIEAGLVISQRWAEGKRCILIITPANLRKQWHQELSEKFFTSATILEAKSYDAEIRAGNFSPFETRTSVVICSYQFARSKAADVARTSWDLVVIDEAHRLRNVYKPSNVIANTLKAALGARNKLLLTATPLQNSLVELFGLISFIDEHAFGDVKSFREKFSGQMQEQTFEMLRERLKPICHRTLRRQVTAYVPYTKRHAILVEFSPDEAEDKLYDLVTAYLQRENLQALPSGQRALMTLVLRKLLASSSFAIAGALTSISERLQSRLDQGKRLASVLDTVEDDYDALEETADEWPDNDVAEPLSEANIRALEMEIAELRDFAALATSIQQNAKGRALLAALEIGFKQARDFGAAEKAIIFTESRRTQSYILRVLANSPWADSIVLFNGSNTDDRSRAIYQEWLSQHSGSDRVTGSRTADMRSALVDYFQGRGKIMIATEAGAEGINLQFCAMVVNYDLPWNPQRIEQRIGRCHRYGQKYDVVVVNFINKKNEADERVYQLLSDKFKLFSGVFGASDEVLGAIESGVDFEKRIADIYQQCRQPAEIREAFDSLQLELSLEINDAMSAARRKLLDNFDDEVREKLRIRDEDTAQYLEHFERQLMRLAEHELADTATFLGGSSFQLDTLPEWTGDRIIPIGLYELPRRSGEAHMFRLSHPLGEAIVAHALQRELPNAELLFDYGAHQGLISSVEALVGKYGWMKAEVLSIDALDQSEDHVLLAGGCDDGAVLNGETLTRLLSVGARVGARIVIPAGIEPLLDSQIAEQQNEIRRTVSERNARFFESEAEKLDGWADDLKVGLERELKELDRRIKETRKTATLALTLEEKLAGQKALKALEVERSTKRRTLFDAQDRVDAQRAELIAHIEGKLMQQVQSKPHLRSVGLWSRGQEVRKKQKLELTWVGKENRPRLEPRILIEDSKKSYHATTLLSDADIFDNVLIHGDNLLALKALEAEYTGRVKCVFIDPPYNTGSAFAHYDDGLEHSIWLGLMRDRIEIIKRLLSETGSLWMTVDDNEAHYLKVLCDEIFGRSNFVANLAWHKRVSPANDAKYFSADFDHVLIYAANKERWRPIRLERSDQQLAYYKNPDNDPRGTWNSSAYTCAKSAEERPNLYYPIINPNTGKEIWPSRTRVWAYDQNSHMRNVEQNFIYWGKNGQATMPRIKKFLEETRKVVPRSIWLADEAGHNQESKLEIERLFPGDPFSTPKPERLLKRVLEIATNPGDLVLDSFAGSGTTGAVAHKMKRRWIMVELGDHCFTHIVPRLVKVIDGSDKGGISAAVGWNGGGGFRCFELAPSLLQIDKWGRDVISECYNAEMLAQALCKLEGFTYSPSSDVYWQQGYSTEVDFIYITTQALGQNELVALSEEVGEARSLLVLCSAFRGNPEQWPNLTLRKIPNHIRSRCEWGHDDYSLNIANLPMSEARSSSPVVQPELFAVGDGV